MMAITEFLTGVTCVYVSYNIGRVIQRTGVMSC
jgi:hypothetical protein